MNQLLGLFVLFGLIFQVFSEQCVKVLSRNCECRTSKYTISLEGYVKKTFVNIPDPNTKTTFYSYNPCAPIDRPKDCDHSTDDTAAVWQRVANNTCYYTADFKNSAFHGDPEKGDLRIDYIGFEKRRTGVKLVCSTDTRLEVIGEKVKNMYNFTLHTPFVCVSGSTDEGLSIGSILLIVFFVLVLVYLGGGMLYLRFKHGARGVEMIPNYDFWLELPALIKDGIVFVSRGCKPEPSYQQI